MSQFTALPTNDCRTGTSHTTGLRSARVPYLVRKDILRSVELKWTVIRFLFPVQIKVCAGLHESRSRTGVSALHSDQSESGSKKHPGSKLQSKSNNDVFSQAQDPDRTISGIGFEIVLQFQNRNRDRKKFFKGVDFFKFSCFESDFWLVDFDARDDMEPKMCPIKTSNVRLVLR